MLRKSFSIKRSENSKEKTFNPLESGTCFLPISLCLRKHLNYRSCVRSHQWLLRVTGGTNIRTTESGSENTTVRRCCKPSITTCPCSDWQHSCQSLHTPQQPCRNANKQTASVFCPCPCSQRPLMAVYVLRYPPGTRGSPDQSLLSQVCGSVGTVCFCTAPTKHSPCSSSGKHQSLIR